MTNNTDNFTYLESKNRIWRKGNNLRIGKSLEALNNLGFKWKYNLLNLKKKYTFYYTKMNCECLLIS